MKLKLHSNQKTIGEISTNEWAITFTYSTYSHFILKVLWCIFKEFDYNEIMQKNKTEWKVKLAVRLFFLEKNLWKISQEQAN